MKDGPERLKGQRQEEERLEAAVRKRRDRLAAGEREGERSIGQNLALIGALGWTIVTPTLLGIFAGRWVDNRFQAGIFWTLGLLVLGLALGCALAWQRMHHE